jgi:hypothetical protein
MPRRAIDKTTEHRISLGTYERNALAEAFALQRENQRLDAVTATLQAAGTALAGGGMVMAAFALSSYLGVKLIPTVIDAVAGDGGALDKVTDIILPSTPVELRREAQALAVRRGQISAQISRYCTASSEHYDERACSLAHDEKDIYFQDRAAHRERVRASNIEQDGFYWRFIFGGLGDVEERDDQGEYASEREWWRYFLNFQ